MWLASIVRIQSSDLPHSSCMLPTIRSVYTSNIASVSSICIVWVFCSTYVIHKMHESCCILLYSYHTDIGTSVQNLSSSPSTALLILRFQANFLAKLLSQITGIWSKSFSDLSLWSMLFRSLCITSAASVIWTIHAWIQNINISYSGKVWRGENLANLYCLIEFAKKVWRINITRSAKKLLIVSTNLDGFSLANHGQFAKFAKPSC